MPGPHPTRCCENCSGWSVVGRGVHRSAPSGWWGGSGGGSVVGRAVHRSPPSCRSGVDRKLERLRRCRGRTDPAHPIEYVEELLRRPAAYGRPTRSRVSPRDGVGGEPLGRGPRCADGDGPVNAPYARDPSPAAGGTAVPTRRSRRWRPRAAAVKSAASGAVSRARRPRVPRRSRCRDGASPPRPR